MADQLQKTEKNVSGKYYVDSNCIGCGLCYHAVPVCFAKDEESGLAYVQKQPNDETEESKCRKALENCPVQAIGDDGE